MLKLFLLFLAWVLACSAVYFLFTSHWVMVGFAFFTLASFLVLSIVRSNKTPNA